MYARIFIPEGENLVYKQSASRNYVVWEIGFVLCFVSFLSILLNFLCECVRLECRTKHLPITVNLDIEM